MQRRRVIFVAALLAMGLMLAGSASGSAPDKLSAYAYEDTRRLVALVEDAAKLVEEQGESAFSEFGRKGSKWFSEPYYLFIYQLDGTCIFHPLQPDWVGKNMSELRDMNGKPMVQLVAQVGERPEKDASGWVFYLWPDKTQLIPQWKSAYVRKVVTPSSKTYVIGSGVYDIKMEKAFVEERVRMAGELLESQGKDAAFRKFRDPASPFVFLGTFVFVLDTITSNVSVAAIRSPWPDWARHVRPMENNEGITTRMTKQRHRDRSSFSHFSSLRA